MASLNLKTGVLGENLAAHLLRRTTYRLTKERIEVFSTKTADEAVEELLEIPAVLIEEPIDLDGQTWISNNAPVAMDDGFKKVYVTGWWLNEAFHDTSICHKMMFFLHTSFTVNADAGNSKEFFDCLAILRQYALGNFQRFAIKMTQNPLMLRYLDGTYNSKGNPNENYAREFFELFTIGKGSQIGAGDYTNYTEADIQQAAKILTGFKAPIESDRMIHIDAEHNIPTGYCDYLEHDTSSKTFSNAFQGTVIAGATSEADMNRELEDFVEMVFAQEETARFICRKIYRFFVSSHIDNEIEQDIIIPLAEIFRNNDYELLPVLQTLLKSQHFYDENNGVSRKEIIGCLFKSPLDLVANIVTYFDLDIPDPINDPGNHYLFFYGGGVYADQLNRSQMFIFRPEVVAGYPAYYQQPIWHRGWFTSSSLVSRYQMPETYITGVRSDGEFAIGGVQLDIVQFVKNNISNPYSAETIVIELLNGLFCETAYQDRVEYFMTEILLDDIDPADWTIEWSMYLSTNDDAEVRIALERLVKFVLFSPEFQLM